MPAMHDLILQSAVIPFAVAAVSAGILRLVAGSTHGPPMAGAAIGIAFLAGYVLILGAPVAWPSSAIQKLFFVTIIGTIFGMSLDLSREARPITLMTVMESLMPSSPGRRLHIPRTTNSIVTPAWEAS